MSGRHARVAALTALDVVVRWGEVTAVRSATLAVASGQLVAVTGPSGAGKTSLLSALAGVMRPAGGEVLVAGTRLTGRDEAVGLQVALIPQGNALAAVLTAAENVGVPLLAGGVPAAEARERTAAALAAVGLEEAAEQLIDELSGGQQQRVAVARGLALRGAVLVADEPTSELDATNRGVVMALLRAEAERGAAVIVATHDPEAAAACDAELRLDDGVAGWVRDER